MIPLLAGLAPKALAWAAPYFKYLAAGLVAAALGYGVYAWLQAKDAKLEEQATKLAVQGAQLSALEESLAALKVVQDQYAKEVETLRAQDAARSQALQVSERTLRATPLKKARDDAAQDPRKSDTALRALNADFNGVLARP